MESSKRGVRKSLAVRDRLEYDGCLTPIIDKNSAASALIRSKGNFNKSSANSHYISNSRAGIYELENVLPNVIQKPPSFNRSNSSHMSNRYSSKVVKKKYDVGLGSILKPIAKNTSFILKSRTKPNNIEVKARNSWKNRTMNFMRISIDSKYSGIMFVVMTFLVLYLDDIRLGFTPKESDPYIDTVFLFCFLAFLIELVFSSISKKGYLFSFFFWLDLVALISMVFDIYYLLNAVSVTFQLPTDATDVARAGRAGKAGTRVGRLLKIVRMIRVFRVAKLYKETKRAMDERRKIFKPQRTESGKLFNFKNVSNKQKKNIDPKMLK